MRPTLLRLASLSVLAGTSFAASPPTPGTPTSPLTPSLSSPPISPTTDPFAGAAPIKVQRFDCGTDATHAKTDFINSIAALHDDAMMSGSPASRARRHLIEKRAVGSIQVDTYFHIVASAAKKSQVSPNMAQAQLGALNSAYNPYNISFNLLGTTWTVNDAWAAGNNTDDTDMKNQLRQGTYSALNIYFQTDLVNNILGKCTLPATVGGSSVDKSVYSLDGCNVNAGTMPAGPIQGYNLGKTAVHEAGHWMGLLHTFEGYSCTGNGDYIKDTAQEATSTDGCPAKPAKDSCKAAAGVDPIHNYMDYSTDACYTGFTKGQQQRMQSMWSMYRQGM